MNNNTHNNNTNSNMNTNTNDSTSNMPINTPYIYHKTEGNIGPNADVIIKNSSQALLQKSAKAQTSSVYRNKGMVSTLSPSNKISTRTIKNSNMNSPSSLYGLQASSNLKDSNNTMKGNFILRTEPET